VLDLKIADLTTDQELLIKARKCVEDLLAADPQLALPEHAILHQSPQEKNGGLSWDKIS
jgi:ATP-dependent DNA helicase RecG